MRDLPAGTDAELHVFGPGYGESLLVHLGCGEWMIVDACRQRGKPPAALKWLDDLGVDVATAVKLVVATHWHDDHVRGLAETLRACDGASFVCSSVLLSGERRWPTPLRDTAVSVTGRPTRLWRGPCKTSEPQPHRGWGTSRCELRPWAGALGALSFVGGACELAALAD